MTDLTKLTVSLTKHGAHKLSILLKQYDKDEILEHLTGSEPGVNIELAQAKKNLSTNRNGIVPEFWNEARQSGSESIDALVLLAIIFSHHLLIDAIRNSTQRNRYAGTVKRNQFSDEKAFTNLAHTIEMLGYSTEHSTNHVRYDFHKLFEIPRLNTLFEKLLRLKLKAAGWDESNSIIEEATALNFHEVFSLSKKHFGTWLVTGSLDGVKQITTKIEDAEFFAEADDDIPVGKFEFRAGHNAKKTGVIIGKAPKTSHAATLLHNKIQNELYKQLTAKYGAGCVGTEVPTGAGTAIDVVIKTDTFCWFYEIKTTSSVKSCIRQAIPQLLEYAYWQATDDRADRLIIVAPKKITPQAAKYLTFLRDRFKLNIHYEQFEPR
ncbi:MAG: hypothetical protein NTW65_01960 [Deltaproteobacteria bacterium]|nr:hypothetical protein [Deltaproteobacteria bacterium]